MGKPMIMGRMTFESIGRALPGRRSIILTRQAGFNADGCYDIELSGGDLCPGGSDGGGAGGAGCFYAHSGFADYADFICDECSASTLSCKSFSGDAYNTSFDVVVGDASMFEGGEVRFVGEFPDCDSGIGVFLAFNIFFDDFATFAIFAMTDAHNGDFWNCHLFFTYLGF